MQVPLSKGEPFPKAMTLVEGSVLIFDAWGEKPKQSRKSLLELLAQAI